MQQLPPWHLPPVQLESSAAGVVPQLPAWHVSTVHALPLLHALHGSPPLPHLPALSPVSATHVAASAQHPSQSPPPTHRHCPCTHVSPPLHTVPDVPHAHLPPTHRSATPLGHGFSHPPQWLMSLSGLMQIFPHTSNPLGQPPSGITKLSGASTSGVHR